MSISTELLKANHIGVRDFKEHLSTKFLHKILVITDRGIPISVSLPYSDMLELVDIIDELSDSETFGTVYEGKKAIREGVKGILASNLFRRIRKDINGI